MNPPAPQRHLLIRRRPSPGLGLALVREVYRDQDVSVEALVAAAGPNPAEPLLSLMDLVALVVDQPVPPTSHAATGTGFLRKVAESCLRWRTDGGVFLDEVADHIEAGPGAISVLLTPCEVKHAAQAVASYLVFYTATLQRPTVDYFDRLSVLCAGLVERSA